MEIQKLFQNITYQALKPGLLKCTHLYHDNMVKAWIQASASLSVVSHPSSLWQATSGLLVLHSRDDRHIVFTSPSLECLLLPDIEACEQKAEKSCQHLSNIK